MSRLDHVAPAFKLDLDALSELLRRALDLVEIERIEALLYVRQLGDIDDAAMKQADDLLGCAGREEDSEPLISGEDRIAGFRRGWNVGQLLRALLARQHERTQGSFLDMRYAWRQRTDADRRVTRNSGGDRCACSPERNVHDIETERHPELLEGEMGLRPGAAGRERVPSGIGPDESDQLIKGPHSEGRVDHDRDRRGDRNRDRREVPDRIVGSLTQ